MTDAIHGSRTQAQRTRALQDFKRGRIKVLVATDIAARGLDIEGLPHVVNFDLPYVPEDYVHRIGRTGRAGMEGDAVSLVCRDEERLLAGIERVTGRRIERVVVEGFEPVRPMRRKPGTANVEVMGRGRSPVAEKQPGRQERPARSERPARQEWSEQPERRASRSTGAERGMAGSHWPSSPAHFVERPVRDGSRPLTRPLFGTQDGQPRGDMRPVQPESETTGRVNRPVRPLTARRDRANSGRPGLETPTDRPMRVREASAEGPVRPASSGGETREAGRTRGPRRFVRMDSFHNDGM